MSPADRPRRGWMSCPFRIKKDLLAEVKALVSLKQMKGLSTTVTEETDMALRRHCAYERRMISEGREH